MPHHSPFLFETGFGHGQQHGQLVLPRRPPDRIPPKYVYMAFVFAALLAMMGWVQVQEYKELVQRLSQLEDATARLMEQTTKLSQRVSDLEDANAWISQRVSDLEDANAQMMKRNTKLSQRGSDLEDANARQLLAYYSPS